MKRTINFHAYGNYGDYILLTAVLPPLKYYGYEIRVIGSNPQLTLLENHPLIDHLVLLLEENNDLDSRNRYADELLGKKAAYCATNVYWHKDPFPENPTHVLNTVFESLEIPVNYDLSLGFLPETLAWGRQFSEFVLIHNQPGCSDYKAWPPHFWELLSVRIQKELGLPVLQIGTPDMPLIPSVQRLEAPSIKHAIAALKYCRLFIGIDSVFNHAAQAVKKPSIILWHSTDPLLLGHSQNTNIVNGTAWKPFMGRRSPLLHCQPCYLFNWDIAAGKVCSHMLTTQISEPASATSSPSIYIPACQAGNSVEAVFQQVRVHLEAI